MKIIPYAPPPKLDMEKLHKALVLFKTASVTQVFAGGELRRVCVNIPDESDEKAMEKIEKDFGLVRVKGQ